MPPRRVYIGLGSNEGDRAGALKRALERLEILGLRPLLKSALYLTAPVEVIDQDEFINQVVEIETDLPPELILESCLAVEQSMGRVRTLDKGPRRIDLDLLLAGEDVRDGGTLKVPHPRMHLRRFVLVPLVEIAPAAWHPILKSTAAELLRICPDRSRVERLGPPDR